MILRGGRRDPVHGLGGTDQSHRLVQLSGKREGSEQVNSFCLSLNNVKNGERFITLRNILLNYIQY